MPKPVKAPKRVEVNEDLADLQECVVYMAHIVETYGDVYAPILDRLTTELAKAQDGGVRGPRLEMGRPRIDSPRRGLRREEAARFVGVSPSKFDAMVADRRMPKPWRFDSCVVWDLKKLDRALDDLDDDGGSSEWD